jgi:alkylhydroperoxidase family enzyme
MRQNTHDASRGASLDREGTRRKYHAMENPRIAPLPPEDWDPETRDALAKTGGGPTGTTLNIFATLANHPKLLKRWMVFANHVLSKSTLSPRHRELLILRTGWLCQSEYEWGQHVLIARAAGISNEEIARVRSGPDAPGWDAFEADLLRVADELHASAIVSDATWTAVAERYDTEQLLDAVFTVGQYHTVAFALNSCGVQLDAGVPGFDDQ